eukprot:scaffold28690_cov63-Phaeocystis_antarctica.AAC.3
MSTAYPSMVCVPSRRSTTPGRQAVTTSGDPGQAPEHRLLSSAQAARANLLSGPEGGLEQACGLWGGVWPRGLLRARPL